MDKKTQFEGFFQVKQVLNDNREDLKAQLAKVRKEYPLVALYAYFNQSMYDTIIHFLTTEIEFLRIAGETELRIQLISELAYLASEPSGIHTDPEAQIDALNRCLYTARNNVDLMNLCYDQHLED